MPIEGFEVELVVLPTPRVFLGEGPSWHHHKQVLLWIDIRGQRLFLYHPQTGNNEQIPLNKRPGCVVATKGDTLAIALENGFHYLDTNTKELQFIADPESDKPQNRFNDGKVDSRGRFWAGTMEIEESGTPLGALYILEPNHSFRKLLDNVTISNGLAWTNDSFYFIDSPLKRIDAFDYDEEKATINNRRTVITIPEDQGVPDGMTIDAEGMLWVCHWGGARVTRWNPKTVFDRTTFVST